MAKLMPELPRRLLRRRALHASALRAVAALCLVTALGLALGACTKCDVPNWSAPRSCHDTPAQQ
jgi:hypothetical protein